MSKPRVLHKHRLGYFPELKVGEDIFTMRYASGCSMSNCHGICCADGVDVDIAERDRILEHAAGAGCTQLDANNVQCVGLNIFAGTDAIASVVINASNLNDTITIGPGPSPRKA